MSNQEEAHAAFTKTEVVTSLRHDQEYGTSTKPPFLVNTENFTEWRRRFTIFVTGSDPKLMRSYQVQYDWPKNARLGDKDYNDMVAEEKTANETEAKAYSLLCQSLPKELDYVVETNPTSATLWDALEKMFCGNATQRKMEGEDLKREFENFCALKGESFRDMMNRFWKMMSKLSQYDIIPGDTEMIDRIVVALPDQWTPLISGLRKEGDFSGLSVHTFVEKLKNEEFHENRRIKHQQRSMGMNASIFGSDKSSSAGTPLKTSGFIASS